MKILNNLSGKSSGGIVPPPIILQLSNSKLVLMANNDHDKKGQVLYIIQCQIA